MELNVRLEWDLTPPFLPSLILPMMPRLLLSPLFFPPGPRLWVIKVNWVNSNRCWLCIRICTR
nr:hypothetical protein Q903MT_gene24 [Picea sitchensis]